MKVTCVVAVVVLVGIVALAQTAPNQQTFNANGVSFDYPSGWTIYDDSNADAQQLTLGRPKNDVQIRVFVHKGRITPEKFPDAKKAFIDPYIASTVKQFVAMGAKPEQSADSSEIAGLNIGSRPASRKKSTAIEDLRAIPWVFSWAQCRLMLPGWYGFGSAVQKYIARHSGSGLADVPPLERFDFETQLCARWRR